MTTVYRVKKTYPYEGYHTPLHTFDLDTAFRYAKHMVKVENIRNRRPRMMQFLYWRDRETEKRYEDTHYIWVDGWDHTIEVESVQVI